MKTATPINTLDQFAARVYIAQIATIPCSMLPEVVDAECGHSKPESARLHHSDTLGVDFAEHINQVRARVSLGVHGANEKGLE